MFFSFILGLLLLSVTKIGLAEGTTYDVNYFSQSSNFLHPLKANEPAPRAEDIVTFKENTYACDTKENYKIFYSHLLDGENSLAQSMLNNATCTLVPTNEKYKVLSADYSVLSHYIQITNIKNNDAAYSLWADPLNVNEIQYSEQNR